MCLSVCLSFSRERQHLSALCLSLSDTHGREGRKLDLVACTPCVSSPYEYPSLSLSLSLSLSVYVYVYLSLWALGRRV